MDKERNWPCTEFSCAALEMLDKRVNGREVQNYSDWIKKILVSEKLVKFAYHPNEFTFGKSTKIPSALVLVS